MDSLSQLALGAAVGQLTISNKIGRKAALIGGAIATLPDLDSIFLQPLDMVSQFVYHRGISHSLVFAVFGGALGAYLSNRFTRFQIGFKQWYLCWFLAFFTHAILDCLTSWGTQLFWPHSYRVAVHSIFIVDPFYTIPLLLGVIGTAIWCRPKAVLIGLFLSSTYLLWGVGAKQYVNHQFEKGLRHQGLSTDRYISRPTPFNTFLWSITVDHGDHYYTGYYSVFDNEPPKTFKKSRPKNHSFLRPFEKNKSLKKLLFFTQNYYLVEPDPRSGKYVIFDTRYGVFGGWDSSQPGVYIFTYYFNPSTNVFTQHRPKIDNMGHLLSTMIKRI